MKRKTRGSLLALAVLMIAAAAAWFIKLHDSPAYSSSVMDVPAFADEAYVVIHDNLPEFSEEDMTTRAYENYAPLDALGRCGYAMACIGPELMPTEERGSIGQVKPSGWQTAKYDFVDGKYLYNRCHLIGYQLTGENANELNLITGTRYLNVEGMLPFENMVADYIKETGNHVLYRVTPVFDGDHLVARGVQMEAWSVEDEGAGICFNVYAYNNQPGVVIDYATGVSALSDTQMQTNEAVEDDSYILNTGTRKFHTADCSQGQSIKEENREDYTGSREELLDRGYTAAKCCDP